ncbi:MAG: 3-deoxy-manno-octulosonate cytidylyltransferase [Candidatus Omnitrophota bacterium]
MMKVIAVIPVRYQSKRFPGKALALLNGKPLIEHVYRQAAKARGISEVVVAADDDILVAAVEKFGGKVRKVTGDFTCGSDRVAWLAKEMEADIFLNIQADEPLMPPEVIEAVLEPFQNPLVLMTTAATPLRNDEEWEDTNVVKVVVDRKGDALYFSRSGIPYDRDGKGSLPSTGAYKHLGIYGFRRDFLFTFSAWQTGDLEETEQLEQLRVLENGARIRVVITPLDSRCVDTPEDLARLNKRTK